MEVKFNHISHAHNPVSAMEILPFVFKIVKPKSVLDIGCGNGSWLRACKDLGINEIFGVDGIFVGKEELLIAQNEFLRHDLTQKLNLERSFDMTISMEVAEHLPEHAADTFVDTLTNHANIILFSAAIPNQGGQYHINEQWPNYWNEKFKRKGFQAFDILRSEFWENEKVSWWYRQNMILYVKKGEETFKEFTPSTTILPYVHPGLYQKKIFKPQYLNSKTEVFTTVLKSFKYLLKG